MYRPQYYMYLTCAAGVAREPNRSLMFSMQLCACVCVMFVFVHVYYAMISSMYTYIYTTRARSTQTHFVQHWNLLFPPLSSSSSSQLRAHVVLLMAWLLLENACYACHIKCVYSFKRLGHIELPRGIPAANEVMCNCFVCGTPHSRFRGQIIVWPQPCMFSIFADIIVMMLHIDIISNVRVQRKAVFSIFFYYSIGGLTRSLAWLGLWGKSTTTWQTWRLIPAIIMRAI